MVYTLLDNCTSAQQRCNAVSKLHNIFLDSVGEEKKKNAESDVGVESG